MKTKREKEQIILSETLNKKYEYGFTTDIDQETLPPGLNEDVVRWISAKKNNLLIWITFGPGFLGPEGSFFGSLGPFVLVEKGGKRKEVILDDDTQD